jgi:DNA-binding MarR family transcriptional regulator
MEVQGKLIALPPLSSNPFSTLPLEASQDHLLVGRVHLKEAMTQYIRFKSPRRILLSGEMGSGRSSLLRCLSNYAPTSVHIDHISQHDTALRLLREMYVQLTGAEAPTGWSQVVDRLVEASRAHTQSLPLIVIDAQHVEMELLSQALRTASSALNRVRCVLVVVIETMQKAQFPEPLLHMFDSDFYLEPFTIDEVQALVESRIKSISTEPFSLSVEDARHLRDKSNGNPSSLIRLLRNAFDASANPASLAGIDQILSLQSEATNGSFPKTDVAESVMGLEEGSESNDSILSVSQMGEAVPQSVDESNIGDALGEGQYLDASTPWNERQSLRESNDDVQILDNMMGFDLDLEELDTQKSSDDELPELPFKALPPSPEFSPIADERAPPVVHGAFSGLVGRFRDTKDASSEQQTGAELWLAEGAEPLPEMDSAKLDVLQEDAGELIHDEVGLFEEPQETDYNHELTQPFVEQNPVSQAPPYAGSDSIAHALQTMIAALSGASETPSSPLQTQRAFIEALAGLQRNPSQNHEEYQLNTQLLQALNVNEMAVLSVAQQRKFSPSDKELLTDLNVKRSRLSQICSKLLRAGILNARTVGRQRFYTMTPNARAQLGAWGVEGGEA